VYVTLSRSKVTPTSNIVTGTEPSQAIQVAGVLPGEVPYQIVPNFNSAPNMGLTPTTGNIPGQSQFTLIEPYISASNPNGQYHGLANLNYKTDQGTWATGPTLYYTINLTN
jgi:hypothetical protein